MTAPSSIRSPILFSLNWHSSGELAQEDLEHILMLLAGVNESGAECGRLLGGLGGWG